MYKNIISVSVFILYITPSERTGILHVHKFKGLRGILPCGGKEGNDVEDRFQKKIEKKKTERERRKKKEGQKKIYDKGKNINWKAWEDRA